MASLHLWHTYVLWYNRQALTVRHVRINHAGITWSKRDIENFDAVLKLVLEFLCARQQIHNYIMSCRMWGLWHNIVNLTNHPRYRAEMPIDKAVVTWRYTPACQLHTGLILDVNGWRGLLKVNAPAPVIPIVSWSFKFNHVVCDLIYLSHWQRYQSIEKSQLQNCIVHSCG